MMSYTEFHSARKSSEIIPNERLADPMNEEGINMNMEFCKII